VISKKKVFTKIQCPNNFNFAQIYFKRGRIKQPEDGGGAPAPPVSGLFDPYKLFLTCYNIFVIII